MGKKKSNNASKHRMSFEELVSGKTLQYMKPYIAEVVGEVTAYYAKQISARLMSDLSDVVHHQAVFRDLARQKFGIEDEQYMTLVAEKEDLSMGLDHVDGPAEKGHFLRISISGKDETTTEYSEPNRWKIAKLAEPRNGEVYTINKEVEEAIIGMREGEEKEIPQYVKTKVKGEDGKLEDKTFTYHWKVKIDRISAKKKVEEKVSAQPQEPQEANQ